VLLPVLHYFGINSANLGYFVLDNASNNNTTLIKLARSIDFLPAEQRLRYIGYVLNLIAEQYLFGQDASSFKANYKIASISKRRQL
jgi:hypothetical protein